MNDYIHIDPIRTTPIPEYKSFVIGIMPNFTLVILLFGFAILALSAFWIFTGANQLITSKNDKSKTANGKRMLIKGFIGLLIFALLILSIGLINVWTGPSRVI